MLFNVESHANSVAPFQTLVLWRIIFFLFLNMFQNIFNRKLISNRKLIKHLTFMLLSVMVINDKCNSMSSYLLSVCRGRFAHGHGGRGQVDFGVTGTIRV